MTDNEAFDLANDYHDCEICGRENIVSMKAMVGEPGMSSTPGLCAPCIALVPVPERDYTKRKELIEKIRAKIAEKVLLGESAISVARRRILAGNSWNED